MMIFVALSICGLFSLVSAGPSPEMPAILGTIVQESEFNEDLFFLIAINDNEEDNFWVKMDENTTLINPFGEVVPIYHAHVGVRLVILCYEYKATLVVLEALMFYPEESSEEDADEEEQE